MRHMFLKGFQSDGQINPNLMEDICGNWNYRMWFKW